MLDETKRAERIILLGLAAFLPTIALIPVGGYFLWRDGWLLYWAIGAFVISALVYFVQWLLLRKSSKMTVAHEPAVAADRAKAGAASTASAVSPDVAAMAAITRFGDTLDIERLTTTDGALAVAEETLTLVARQFHPDRPDAIWQFTVPQALAIAEQVSRRLHVDLVSKIPFGDRLTLAQVFNLYKFRSVFTVAEKLYDVWRVVRMVNPATAATHEARERVSKAAVNWGRDQFMRRIARAYVQQVGRAGIDLYRGRLAAAKPDPAAKVTSNAP